MTSTGSSPPDSSPQEDRTKQIRVEKHPVAAPKIAMSSIVGKSLGILISCKPSSKGFKHGVALGQSATRRGVRVFLYLIDEAVNGVLEPSVAEASVLGAKVMICGYACERYRPAKTLQTQESQLAPTPYPRVGLAALDNLIQGSDRFVSFN